MHSTLSLPFLFALTTLVWASPEVPKNAASQTALSHATLLARDHEVIPDRDEDMAPAMQALLDHAQSLGEPAVVILDPGVYYLDGGDDAHAALVVQQARDLIIRGAGDDTRLILRNPRMGAFYIAEGDNVWVENLSIDHDPLPYTQGHILLVNREMGWFDFVVQTGYPLLSEPWFASAPKPYGQWGMIFDRTEPRLKEGAADFIFLDKWEQISRGAWRIYPVGEQVERLKDMRMGERFVHLARHGRGGAVFFLRSRECGVRDVTVYASQSLAVGAVGSDRISVDGMRVVRKPDSDRLLSANADGVHIQQNIRGPIIQNCTFEGMADDGINIYYYPNTVSSVVSETVVRADRRGVIEAGDWLLFFESSAGRVLAETTVREIRVTPDNEYRIALDTPSTALAEGTGSISIYNMSRCGAEFVIRNNVFQNHRRHGMMIKAPHGLIEDNVMIDLGGLGIVAGNDPDWPEGAIPSDLLIRNNRIENIGRSRWYGTDSRGAAIQLLTKADRGMLAQTRGITEITLENTTIINPPGAALYIGAAHDVFITDLKVRYDIEKEPPRRTAAVLLENASGVVMEHIYIETGRPEVESGILVRNSVDEGEAGLILRNIRITGPPGMATIQDYR